MRKWILVSRTTDKYSGIQGERLLTTTGEVGGKLKTSAAGVC